ncbi:uncharacterized protein EV420DRAFT_1480512 [Desarmillaria tabescens]|uniref:T6SS Phospholipase effector Tle1-like catalytic domain-containing protein n=1 Tax=Armillaria tabescens TaxID=1929756 RepID=A0AA39KCS6_ARMTA|nr:uncharacterized protein EV420DRAFT_1480512 [Desarmillaria tabescens]KAK0457434.1 hypothetical protein EV420DRAFT_1480512 [Desarmillaria tabescens]
MSQSTSATKLSIGQTIYLEGSFEEVIPPTHSDRTLVLCFDGTGDQFDSDNSNVVNFFSTLKKDDPTEQLVYYQSGIGTYAIPEVASPITAKITKVIDSMIGIHLNAHVMSGYEFLMQNYEAGDKICIFGFSRGAYTARALAGMVHKVGLLPRANYQQVPFAYKMYSRDDEKGWKQSAAFKKAFSIDVDIYFLGVWDTVGSVGIFPRRLPFTTSNVHVKHFRHALALDEHRVRFIPAFWHRTCSAQHKLGLQRGEMPRSHNKCRAKSLRERESEYDHVHADTPTDVEEVWFAGCHCDVGGGAVANEVRHNLARIPLRWMIRQCFLVNTGIIFHRELLKQLGMEPASLHPTVHPRPAMDVVTKPIYATTEEEADILDALCPIYDELKIAPGWWILELIPTKLRYQKGDNTWAKAITMNRGRPRRIPRQYQEGLKVHRTVKLRMEAEGLEGGKYVPRPRWSVDPTWVD